MNPTGGFVYKDQAAAEQAAHDAQMRIAALLLELTDLNVLLDSLSLARLIDATKAVSA